MDDKKEQDRQLFNQIAIDIRKHGEKYRKAGNWLDTYWGDVIKEQGLSLLNRFTKASQVLKAKYSEQSVISEDDALCIILITWLLTDADAEKANLEITEFEKWSWEPTNDLTCGSRCAASSLWSQNTYSFDSWMNLGQTAWAKLAVEKEFEPGKPVEPDQNIAHGEKERTKCQRICRVVRKVAGWICALVGFLAALLTILYYLGWL